MLERAVGNLVSNADKFSPPGAPITVVSADGMVSVRDAGPGIPAADRERVFDRFFRSDLTRSMPGSGLGLSIVAQIVERHGGRVWARDAEGGGADVGFQLQTVAPTAPESISPSAPASGASSGADPSAAAAE
jgi:two-component system sensor histidine kinase MprB